MEISKGPTFDHDFTHKNARTHNFGLRICLAPRIVSVVGSVATLEWLLPNSEDVTVGVHGQMVRSSTQIPAQACPFPSKANQQKVGMGVPIA
jgi:hypothetical protein